MTFQENLEENSSLEFIGIMMHNPEVHLSTNRMKVTSLIHLFNIK